jgi:flavin-dependent dehydrogenase
MLSPSAMQLASYDVAIVGGGPGGAATALALRAYVPSLSVVLLEASGYDTLRIGEALPPLARRLLEHLGVWESFCGQHHRRVYGTTAAWGSATPRDNDFIYSSSGPGWHLDRTAFDAMLVRQAAARGASVRLTTRLCSTGRAGDQWRLTVSTGEVLATRFVVDATGGSAGLARRCGARFVDTDRLIGIARCFEGSDADPRTLVEAFADGWWYTAGLPDGRRIVACMTDADLARHMRLSEPHQWCQLLAAMPHISAAVRGTRPCSPIFVRSTASRRLEPAAGDGWLAVGDAASRFDPLSSQGIAKALRSGIFASYAIGDWLTRADAAGLRRYCRYIRQECNRYLETRARYYSAEQRWPASEFWRRRHAIRPSSGRLDISPRT